MSSTSLVHIQTSLNSIKRIEQDLEYWSARDLMVVLGYKTWRKFNETIKRSKDSCKNSDKSIKYHFVGADKMIKAGKGAQRKVEDILLTRFACYLIAQNGDPRKPEIALAQTYFATQTRKQELLEQRQIEDKRLEARSKLKITEKKIGSTIYERGVRSGIEFATFKDKHIRALYGGISTKQLKKKRNIPNKRALADFDTNIELKAKDFSLAMTDHNIKKKNMKGLHQVSQEVEKSSKATRKTLISRGIKPENLRPQEDLKKVESRRKKELRIASQNKN
jgi:DNA-damage-inducible protein D